MQVGTAGQPGALDVTGDLRVRGGAALNRTGQWTAAILRLGRLVRLSITIAPGSNSNVVVLRHGLPSLGSLRGGGPRRHRRAVVRAVHHL